MTTTWKNAPRKGYPQPRVPVQQFTIRYYRDAFWAERWEAAGVYKPEGYVTSKMMPVSEEQAKELAAHINSQGPTYPCLVVRA